jgi:putative FmdB family regulatory protein
MPIYEYQCAACGQVTEKWQKISEPPLTLCPACGGALSKLISSCAFHLKGSGWYVTDYAGKNPSANAGGTAQEAAAGSDSQGGSEKQASSETTEAPAPPKKIK